eukprot:TRINITY_DN9226_c0_g1_i2.p1 TRINITY_DN9226_c0_g1~~TRINITY_DN9226_c0_g1_i2.p1  ORF type:complete len:1120 (+),score=220.78 TRINITY_DN9226_c0_g1_i2:1000-4359(+)
MKHYALRAVWLQKILLTGVVLLQPLGGQAQVFRGFVNTTVLTDRSANDWGFLQSTKVGACTLPWQKEGLKQCPYGNRLPGDVTLPGGDVLREDSWFFLYVSVLYSFVPYGFGFMMFLKFAWRRGTRELYFLLFLLFIVVCNEVLVKPFFHFKRPDLSCLYSCGMPSSHAAISVGTVTLYMVHNIHRCAPLQIAALDRAWKMIKVDSQGAPVQNDSRCAKINRTVMRYVGLTGVGLGFDESSPADLMVTGLLWLAFLMPVPLCRIALKDHTAGQVYVGGGVGCGAALLWTFISQTLQYRYNAELGWTKKWRGRIVLHHNLPLPCYEALRLMYTKKKGRAPAAESSRTSGTTLESQSPTGQQSFSGGVQSINSAEIRQLKWYERETIRWFCKCQSKDWLDDDTKDYLKYRWIFLRRCLDTDPDTANLCLELVEADEWTIDWSDSFGDVLQRDCWDKVLQEKLKELYREDYIVYSSSASNREIVDPFRKVPEKSIFPLTFTRKADPEWTIDWSVSWGDDLQSDSWDKLLQGKMKERYREDYNVHTITGEEVDAFENPPEKSSFPLKFTRKDRVEAAAKKYWCVDDDSYPLEMDEQEIRLHLRWLTQWRPTLKWERLWGVTRSKINNSIADTESKHSEQAPRLRQDRSEEEKQTEEKEENKLEEEGKCSPLDRNEDKEWLQKLTANIEKQEADLGKAAANFEKQAAELERTRAEKQRLARDKEELAEDLVLKQKANEVLESAKSEMKKELTEAMILNEQNKKILKDMEDGQNRNTQKIYELEIALSEAKKRLAREEQLRSAAQERNGQLNELLQKKEGAANQVVHQMQQRLDECREEQNQKLALESKLQRDVSNLLTETTKLQKELKNVKEEASQQLKRKQEELISSKSALQDAQTLCTSMENEIRKFKSEVRNEQTQLEIRHRAELSQLTIQHQREQSQEQSMTRQWASYCEKLQAKLKESESMNRELREELQRRTQHGQQQQQLPPQLQQQLQQVQLQSQQQPQQQSIGAHQSQALEHHGANRPREPTYTIQGTWRTRYGVRWVIEYNTGTSYLATCPSNNARYTLFLDGNQIRGALGRGTLDSCKIFWDSRPEWTRYADDNHQSGFNPSELDDLPSINRC